MVPENPPASRFGWHETDDFTFATVARGAEPAEFVAVDTTGKVYSSSTAWKGVEAPIESVLDMRTHMKETGIIRKVVRVAGQVYALGNYRKIYRRIGREQWIELGSEARGFPMPPDVAANYRHSAGLGFMDMSAFAADDLYAAGGLGDVWRFAGSGWIDCAFPVRAKLLTVCCAGDGLVYISELNGSVWAGRETQWTLVAESDIAPGSQPVDAAWFNDRLYLGGQEGLWAIDPQRKALVPLGALEPDAPNPTNGGRLDLSADGRFLLTAGPYGAWLNDGSGWRRLFNALDY